MTTDSTDIIDSKNHEIRPEDEQVYSKMEDLADELPESSPRFILLSYPLTLVRPSTFSVHAVSDHSAGFANVFVTRDPAA